MRTRARAAVNAASSLARAASNKARTSVFPPWDSRGTATGNRSPGPDPSAPRAEVARAPAPRCPPGAPRKERARRRPNGPGRFLSFQRPAGRRRAKQSLFAACVCLAETVEPGACGPDQASCSGRVGLRPDLVTSACAPPRAKRNSSACPGCRLAASRRMRPCASRAIAYPRASVLPDPARAAARGGGQPVARLQAQPRVAWPSCRAAFATRSPRGACRACDVPGVARARRRALRALRRGPGGRQPEAQAVQALALMFQALRRRHQLAGGAVEALGGPLQPPLLAARQRAPRP